METSKFDIADYLDSKEIIAEYLNTKTVAKTTKVNYTFFKVDFFLNFHFFH